MTGQSKPIEKHSEGNDGSTVEKDKMKNVAEQSTITSSI
jgi:hypothetical protein